MKNKQSRPRTRKKRQWSSPAIRPELLHLRESLFDTILDSEAMSGLPDIFPPASSIEEQLAFLLILRALNGDMKACTTILDIAFD